MPVECGNASEFKTVNEVVVYLQFSSSFDDVPGIDKDSINKTLSSYSGWVFQRCAGKSGVRTVVVNEKPENTPGSIVIYGRVSREAESYKTKITVSYEAVWPIQSQIFSENSVFPRSALTAPNVVALIGTIYSKYMYKILGVVPRIIPDRFNVH